MPRVKDTIWDKFERIAQGTGYKEKCRVCGTLMQGIVARMKSHSVSEGCRPTIINESDDEVVVIQNPLTAAAAATPRPAAPTRVAPLLSTPNSKRPRQDTGLNSYVVKTTKSDKEDIDELRATMVYATNCPFRIVEHETFVALLEKLRPGYKLPTRKDIGGCLLAKVHEKMQKVCRQKLEGETVCMSMDGWSNIHNEPIVCVAVTDSSGKTYVTDTLDTSGTPHNTDNITQIAQETITKTQTMYGCKVGSFVTGNAANMAAMRRELLANDDLDGIAYGCGAHVLNMLAKDLELPNVHKHVEKVIKYFRNTHLPSAWYVAR